MQQNQRNPVRHSICGGSIVVESTHDTRTTANQAKNAVKCDQCGKEYEKNHPNQRFCNDKCKAKWHRVKPLGSGVQVTNTGSRNLKSHIEVKLIVSYANREKLAKILLPGADLYLARTTEDLFE